MQKPLSFLPTFKAHNILLLCSSILLGLVVYGVNIKKTVAMHQQYVKQQVDIQRAATAATSIREYRSQLASFQQSALQTYDREWLLERLTSFCRQHSILVSTFPEAQRVVENGNGIISNTIEVEGRYQDIAELVYMIEQEERMGSVSTLKFFSEKDRLTKELQLKARMVIRNLEE